MYFINLIYKEDNVGKFVTKMVIYYYCAPYIGLQIT